MRYLYGLLLLLLGLLVAPRAHAQEVASEPQTLNFQGVLLDDEGQPVEDPPPATFTLVKNSEEVWSETQTVQPGPDGLFTVQLGDGEMALPLTAWFPSTTTYPTTDIFYPTTDIFYPTTDVFLRLSLGGTTVSEVPLTAAPFAFLAHQLHNPENLLLVTDKNAALLLDNDGEGEPGRFAIFGADVEGPPLVEVVAGDGGAEVEVAGQVEATGPLMMRYPPPQMPPHLALGSDEGLHLYTGNVTLDGTGAATVALPAWFDDDGFHDTSAVRYSLTPVGAAMPNLHVAQPWDGSTGAFTISGGQPGQQVSWQIAVPHPSSY